MARPASTLNTLLERPDAERRLGPFVLVEQLGRGGFAPVWLAREIYGSTVLRTAAVKLFSLHAGEGDKERIIEEARALCRVEHPNVVRFYSLPIDEANNVVGLAMEHVAGTSIDKRIAAHGTLSVGETLAIGVAIASALSAVHRAGLVHRDVKPPNVIEAGGDYKLIDFGIAAADEVAAASPPPSAVEATSGDGTNDGATGTGAFRCGTIGYIDPECVATGNAAEPASDLYALGAMLFECLTGKVPAAAKPNRWSPLRLDILDGRSPPPPLAEIAPNTPPALAALVDRLIAPARSARPASAESVAIQLARIRADLAGGAREMPPEDVGPFRGLGRFEESDRDVYFGRTTEIAGALETLRGRGLVALIGASGSGKSSLARAGILPAVASAALGAWPKRWDTAVCEPGRDPRAAMLAALAPFLDEDEDDSPPSIVRALAERAESEGRGTILLVDQLEELASVGEGESLEWAVELLVRLAERPLPGVRVLVAARRDLLHLVLARGDLGRAVARGTVLIEPISEATWGDVLDQALGAYGYAFEDDALRGRLLAELGDTADAMPLVQFALTELWRRRDVANKRITTESFDELGGVAGALERHADATLARSTSGSGDIEDAARSLLLALTTAQGTRAQKRASELEAAIGPASVPILSAFEEARLVVRASGGVTIAHEALLRQWSRLRGWIAEAREDRLVAEELERDAARWSSDRDSTPLWPRRRLAFAGDVRRRATVTLSPGALAFLDASRRADLRARLLAWSSIAVVIISVVVVLVVRARASEDALRREADKNRVVKEKQAQIDELLRTMSDSKEKERALQLQREIEEVQGGSSAPHANATATPVVARPTITPPPSIASTAPAASTAAKPGASADDRPHGVVERPPF